MWYELWHIQSANLIDDFADEADALAAARAYLTPDAGGQTVDVLLVVRDDADQIVRSFEGEALARLAFGSSDGTITTTGEPAATVRPVAPG